MYRGTSPQRHPWFRFIQRTYTQVTRNYGLGADRVLSFDLTPHVPSLDRDGQPL